MRNFRGIFFAFIFAFLASSEGLSARSRTEAESVTIAKSEAIYYKVEDNKRELVIPVVLPQTNPRFAKVTLDFQLSCPQERCDAWDRFGSFGILDAGGRYLELFRFMTPYGIGARWTADLSDFLPLLDGKKNFRIFIDTWVGQGHPQGNGWLVDATLRYEEGDPEKRAIFVQPLLSVEDIAYGDPLRPTQRIVSLRSLPRGGSARIRALITGHGQGNAENCAEFCSKLHTLTFAGQTFEKKIWRDDCATSVDPQQKGNYRSSRAGWCPGDQVQPWVVDINDSVESESSDFRYDVESFSNSCRPDAPVCGACVFGTSCKYDGGLHTEPRFYVSAYVIYRR